MEEKDEKNENIFNQEFIIKISRITIALTLMLISLFCFKDKKLTTLPFNPIDLTLSLIAYVILAYDIFIEAISDLVKEHEILSEEMLMIIATIGAFLLILFDQNEFFEANMVMLLFQIGELFEDFASYTSNKAITSAIALRSKVAHLVKDEKVIDVNPVDVKVDDIILVKVGEIIPSDGIIIEGSSFIDMSSLTGESVPVKKEINDTVYSGTILKEGTIKIKVNKEYDDNTVSKILKLIEDGTNSKSKVTRFIDKFAKIYTPIVVIIAFMIAIIPPLCISVSNVWKEWIYKSLNILVISCPCAIVISVPLAYFAGIGLASKNGIIIKGGAILDQLNNIGTLVSDKTGTLTYGTFKIVNKDIVADIQESEFDKLLLIAESLSNHPIAKAIISDSDVSLYQKDVSNYQEISGKGISCYYQNKHILAGNNKLLDTYNIKYKINNNVGTIIYLAVDNKFIGSITLADEIRSDSKILIDNLHKANCKVIMLTGDKKEIALDTANKLNIDEVNYQLLPEDKIELLKKQIENKNNKSVAYIGDGINDAACIALADIGIAMGKEGADLAIDNSDVVLMKDNPSKLITAIKIAKLVKVYALFDIIFSLLIKTIIMILATTLPSFPLYISVVADTGVTMLLVIITMTLLYHKFKKDKK